MFVSSTGMRIWYPNPFAGAHDQRVREERRVARRPVVGRVLPVVPLHEAALVDAVLEEVELELQVARGVQRPREVVLLVVVVLVVAVQVLEVDRVVRVVHALKPIAGQRPEMNLADQLRPGEELPTGQQRRRRRAHVRPDQAAELLRGIGLDLERQTGGLKGHVHDLALDVVGPAVVGAPQPILLRDAVGQADGAVRAGLADEANLALQAPEEGQVFAKDSHGLDGLLEQLLDGADRLPVAAHHLAHRRAWPYPRHAVVGLLGDHRLSPVIRSAYRCPILVGADATTFAPPRRGLHAPRPPTRLSIRLRAATTMRRRAI